MQLTLGEIAKILAVPRPVAGAPVTGYSIDSRTIRPGELFFAIRGPRFDGHHFVATALSAGAAGAVVEEAWAPPVLPADVVLLRVAGPPAALETLAAEVRRRWGGPLVAVTGSAGKTTTKEMIAAALATRLRVLKSEGNLNNQYGVPLSLLRLEPEHQAGVFELGMSRAGEIAALARLARPNIGVVTCVAPVHLEFFSGMEGIAAAKRELIEGLPPDGTAVLNADDAFVSRFADGFPGRSVTFGIECPADFLAAHVQATGRGARFRLEWAGDSLDIELGVAGRHNVRNALAAVATAQVLGISPAEAAGGLAAFRPQKMRGEWLDVRGATVLSDCYNSNPRALESMLQVLAETPALGRRIAVLGEMRELGPASLELHREAGRRAASAADYIVAVAGDAQYLIEGAAAAGMDAARLAFFAGAREAGRHVASLVQPGDVVLFKGSRGVKLEDALEEMKNEELRMKN